MGMSTFAVGLRSADDPAYQNMVRAAQALTAAGLEWPREIEDYFHGETSLEAPLTVELPLREYKDDMEEGYELDVKDIPQGVVTIRFWNSW